MRDDVVDAYMAGNQPQLAGTGTGDVEQVVDHATHLGDLTFDDRPHRDDVLRASMIENGCRGTNRRQRMAQLMGDEREEFHLPRTHTFGSKFQLRDFRRGQLQLLTSLGQPTVQVGAGRHGSLRTGKWPEDRSESTPPLKDVVECVMRAQTGEHPSRGHGDSARLRAHATCGSPQSRTCAGMPLVGRGASVAVSDGMAVLINPWSGDCK
jgi:hypothetical protein